ncbi:uroporphyrinogen-III synthase [Acinetobacter suaedae]|uniref:Uroporphyrinogen-III synthase n=1 Tax=Acinetobacter suaedae TaxID=2609668 RepID=A0A5P1UYA2_9GAMM|nr:uroporphyrinogen-III synthase [Acinetobacter sp. C16S1]QER40810.1 uroporphyrinogen-III synthase [Acinetobacter sp. C16S1]
MRFINTRPKDRADRLTQAMQGAGYEVECLPLLELIAEPFSEALQQLYQQLDQVQVIVAVSPTAVDIGMRYLDLAGIALHQLTHIRWIAVGQATAKALAQFGIQSDVPAVESSEGMLDLPLLKQQKNLQKIAFWRGLGGRQFMMQQLQQKGVTIANFVLYRRQCPQESFIKFPQLLERMKSDQPVAVLISSEASWQNWLQLCAQNPCKRTWIYLVLGERLMTILNQTQHDLEGAINIIQLENLSASEIIQRMSNWRGVV